jgi:hypothetical protein
MKHALLWIMTTNFGILFRLFEYHIFTPLIKNSTDPVAVRSQARALSARTLDRWFESRLGHGCLSSSVFVVLFLCR